MKDRRKLAQQHQDVFMHVSYKGSMQEMQTALQQEQIFFLK